MALAPIIQVGGSAVGIREGVNALSERSGYTANILEFIPEARRAGIYAGTDTDDCSEILQTALESGATRVLCDTGTMYFDKSVITAASDIELILSPGFSFKGTALLDGPLLKFLLASNVHTSGGFWDASGIRKPDGLAARDLLAFDQCTDFSHTGGIFVGVYDPTESYTLQESRGDSGIFASASTRGKIINPTFRNMADCGIYVNATPSDSNDLQILGGHFYQCYTAIAIKREAVGTQIIAPQIRNCYYGITTEAASGGPIPGKQVIITSPRLIDCYYPMILRWADYTVVSSPYIENALGDETVSAGAIWFQGTQYGVVSDPIIIATTTPKMVAGIFLTSRTENGVTDKISTFNRIDGGSITGFNQGVRENSGTAANRNYVLDTLVFGATDEGSTIDLRGAESYYRKIDTVNQVEKWSGDRWLNTASASLSWKSIDGGTWQKGILRADTLDLWYRTTSRIAQINSSGLSLDKDLIMNGLYNSGAIRLRGSYLWVDATGDLRIKASAPSSDTDGTVVGTQS